MSGAFAVELIQFYLFIDYRRKVPLNFSEECLLLYPHPIHFMPVSPSLEPLNAACVETVTTTTTLYSVVNIINNREQQQLSYIISHKFQSLLYLVYLLDIVVCYTLFIFYLNV
jgi:hypothetical protein